MSRPRKGSRRDAAAAAMPAPPPNIDGVEWACSSAARPTDWYWPGAIPAGSVVLLEGRKSTGKSTVAAAIVACCKIGRAHV